MEDNKKLFLSSHLEISDDSLYLGKFLKFSILANGLAKLSKHFSKQKPIFSILAKMLEMLLYK